MRTTPEVPAPVQSASVDERLWTVQEAAAWLGVPVNTMYGWRSKNMGPRAARLGRHLRYVPADVQAWVFEQVS